MCTEASLARRPQKDDKSGAAGTLRCRRCGPRSVLPQQPRLRKCARAPADPGATCSADFRRRSEPRRHAAHTRHPCAIRSASDVLRARSACGAVAGARVPDGVRGPSGRQSRVFSPEASPEAAALCKARHQARRHGDRTLRCGVARLFPTPARLQESMGVRDSRVDGPAHGGLVTGRMGQRRSRGDGHRRADCRRRAPRFDRAAARWRRLRSVWRPAADRQSPAPHHFRFAGSRLHICPPPDGVKSTPGRMLRWGLTAAIVFLLVVFARTVNWTAAWSSIRHASLPLLAIAVAANFLSIAIKGVRWWLFLKPAGAPSLGLATRATLAGTGLNNVLVANGGDAARVVFVTRATGLPSSRVLATLALERMFDLVGFLVLLVYGIVAFDLSDSLEKWAIPAQRALAVVFGLLAWFVYTSRHITELHDQPSSSARGFGGKVKSYFTGFAASTRSLATGPRFIGALVISILAWSGQIATFEFSAAAAHVPIPSAGSLAALLATNLGLLVRATPGNVGIFQLAYVLSVGAFGVTRSDAIAVSILIQTIQIIPLTAVGVALAPEFIFKRAKGTRDEASTVVDGDSAPLRRFSEEGEELPAVSRET